MIEASAIWLVPGLQHPVYERFARFFRSLFGRFEVLDYREIYLRAGRAALERAISDLLGRSGAQLLVYSQFPSSYAYIRPDFLAGLRDRTRVVALGFDDEIYFEQARFFYVACDAVITTDISGAAWLEAAGIPVYLAQLQQPLTAEDTADLPEDIDASFIGDMSKPGRRELVRALEAAGVAVTDYGAGSRNGRLGDQQVLEVFRRSRINLNFTRTNPPAWVLRNHPERATAGQIKGRPFELAAL